MQLRITGDDQMEIKIGNGVAVPVEHLGVNEGFVSGQAALRVTLPETDDQPSEIQLNLRADKNHVFGTMRTESLGDLPRFGLPVYVSLSKN